MSLGALLNARVLKLAKGDRDGSTNLSRQEELQSVSYWKYVVTFLEYL